MSMACEENRKLCESCCPDDVPPAPKEMLAELVMRSVSGILCNLNPKPSALCNQSLAIAEESSYGHRNCAMHKQVDLALRV